MTKKICVYNEQITRYLDGELDREAAASLREHIESCPHCSQELKKWEEMFELLKLPEEDPGPEFTSSVLHAIHIQNSETAELKKDPWNMRNFALVLLGIFLLAISISVWLLTGAWQLPLIHTIGQTFGIFVAKILSLLPAPLVFGLYQVGNYLTLFIEAVLTGMQQKLFLLLSLGETFFMLIRLLPPIAWVVMLVAGFISCLILGRVLENKAVQ